MTNHKTDHRTYLAAAFTAAAFTDSRRAELVAHFETWAACVEHATSLSDALFQACRAHQIVWGETHDQYDVLDRMAEFWYAEVQGTRPTRPAAEIVEHAIDSSQRHYRAATSGHATCEEFIAILQEHLPAARIEAGDRYSLTVTVMRMDPLYPLTQAAGLSTTAVIPSPGGATRVHIAGFAPPPAPVDPIAGPAPAEPESSALPGVTDLDVATLTLHRLHAAIDGGPSSPATLEKIREIFLGLGWDVRAPEPTR